ncbi:hypothetical protein FQN54_009296 [Arachnomyces sp. PD_36]|nr:hypothetical protein FQN54_009296 [Arachnomyces sp. PD_36]
MSSPDLYRMMVKDGPVHSLLANKLRQGPVKSSQLLPKSPYHAAEKEVRGRRKTAWKNGSAIYSPINGKTIWRQDHKHHNPKYGVPGELTPISIGGSVLHCAGRGSNRDKFDPVGIDFRASERTIIYESSAVSSNQWPEFRTCRGVLLMGGKQELVFLSDTESWVGTGRVSILNGENGQLLFRFEGGPAHFGRYCYMLADPTINQFSIQSVPARVRLDDAVRHWEAHAESVAQFVIIQTFSISGFDDHHTGITRLSVDLILSPYHYGQIAVQPFAKVAVVIESNDRSIASYPLIETKETHLIQLAEAVLKESIPRDSSPPTLRHCLILRGPGIKFSSKPSSSSHGLLALARETPIRHIKGFVDGGRLLPNATQIQFLWSF